MNYEWPYLPASLPSFGLTLVTAPTRLLLTLEEAKSQLSILEGCDCDEADLERRIREATDDAQRECGRQFLSATYKLLLDDFPRCGHNGYRGSINIPLGKVSAVGAVRYYDTAGTLQTLSSSNYFTALAGEPARIVAKPSSPWPTVQLGRPEAVEIEFTAGWSSPDQVPADILGAVKLILADRYFNRGDDAKVNAQARSIPAGAMRVLTNQRAHGVA
jgi:uncharacterized phiE125 gp8 family phage protein